MDNLKDDSQLRYQLHTQMINNQLKVTFSISNDETADMLTLTISSLSQYSRLQEYFDSLEELKQYFQAGNYVLNSLKPQIDIIGKVNTLKTKNILLARLPLNFIKADLTSIIKNIIKECSESHQRNITQQQSYLWSTILRLTNALNKHAEDKNCGCRNFTITQNNVNTVKKEAIEIHNNEFQEIRKQIEQLKIEIQNIDIKFKSDLNKKDKENKKQIKIILEDSLQQIKQIYQPLQANFFVKIDEIQKQLSFLNQKFKNIYKTISGNDEKINSESSEKQEDSPLQNSVRQRLVSFQLNQNRFIQHSQSQLLERNKIKQWINTSLTSKCLQISKDNTIIAKAREGVIVSQITIKGKYEFGVKLTNIMGSIGIGIIDVQSIRKKKLLTTPNNNVFICMSNGEYYHGKIASLQNKIPKFSFKQSQILYISVNLGIGTISWRSKDCNISISNEKLLEKGIDWVPYIRLSRGCGVQLEV